MYTLPLEFQPCAPGPGFFITAGIVFLGVIIGILSIIDLLFSDIEHYEDRVLWILLIICTAGLASFIYLFRAHKLKKKKDPDIIKK